MDGYGRWISFVRTLVGGLFFVSFPCASRILELGLRIAWVVLFRMYYGLGWVGTGVLLGTYSLMVVQARIGSRSISYTVINKRN